MKMFSKILSFKLLLLSLKLLRYLSPNLLPLSHNLLRLLSPAFLGPQRLLVLLLPSLLPMSPRLQEPKSNLLIFHPPRAICLNGAISTTSSTPYQATNLLKFKPSHSNKFRSRPYNGLTQQLRRAQPCIIIMQCSQLPRKHNPRLMRLPFIQIT